MSHTTMILNKVHVLPSLFALLLFRSIQAAVPDAILTLNDEKIYITKANFGGKWDNHPMQSTTTPSDDPWLCNEANGLTSYSVMDMDSDNKLFQDHLVLVPRGNCTFERKTLSAQRLGASGVIVYNTLSSRYGLEEDGNTKWPASRRDYECDKGSTEVPMDQLTFVNNSYDPVNDHLLSDGGPLCPLDPVKCESRRCLLTGSMTSIVDEHKNDTFIQACCAWDILLSMNGDDSIDQQVAIPAAFITMEQGDLLLSKVGEYVSIRSRDYPTVNASSALLLILGVFVTALAAYLSAGEYRTKRKQIMRLQTRFENSDESTAPVVSEGQPTINDHVRRDGLGSECVQATNTGSQDDRGREGPMNITDETEDVAPETDEETPTNLSSVNQTPATPVMVTAAPREAAHRVMQQEALELNTYHAVAFIFVASAVLLVIFYFEIYTIINVVYGIACSGATATVMFHPFYRRVIDKAFGKDQFIACPRLLRDMAISGTLASLTGYTWGVVWLYVSFTRDEPSQIPFYWITQNIFGACLAILFLGLIRLSSIKVAAILLLAAFIYDIFFVFLTPLILESGESVMVTVATGGGKKNAELCEKYPDSDDCKGGQVLPMVFSIPRINDFRGGSSLLGLGDIILPGLLVSFAARLDEARRLVALVRETEVPFSIGYYIPQIVAYAVGLFGANLGVYLMQSGQPALLYLVPTCLGTLCLQGRKELKQLWVGPTELKEAKRILRRRP